ncbi:hypothetical protein SAMN05216233_108105 [Desulfoluna spongiiphila]|uniref:Uncharacterized protein n=1 Tax=Desulfoluna spongiiphila TaxID=419481 RepID=A0A1G5FJE3_9BACT|nr:hypothetical protein SAMN05216233_108105 [Desulfoluna spongiiphila]VVS95567.1 hypothetical protein DBB_51440 [Desulfoluna spongiiphila]
MTKKAPGQAGGFFFVRGPFSGDPFPFLKMGGCPDSFPGFFMFGR